MTDEQKTAIAKADAAMAPALELYAERNKLAVLYYRLPLADLKRVNALLRRLSDDELRLVAAYAEALADWREPAEESQHAEIAQGPGDTSFGG